MPTYRAIVSAETSDYSCYVLDCSFIVVPLIISWNKLTRNKRIFSIFSRRAAIFQQQREEEKERGRIRMLLTKTREWLVSQRFSRGICALKFSIFAKYLSATKKDKERGQKERGGEREGEVETQSSLAVRKRRVSNSATRVGCRVQQIVHPRE